MYRHNHRHSSDSGIATLIGLILTIILLRSYVVGDLFNIVNAIGFKATGYSVPSGQFATMESMESMGSVSYVLVAFVANLVYGVGQFAILVWTGLGWIISDIIAGYRQWSAERIAKPTDASPDFSQLTGQPVNVRVVEPDPMEQILGQFQDNLLSLQDSLIELSNRVEAIDRPKPATRTTRARAKT